MKVNSLSLKVLFLASALIASSLHAADNSIAWGGFCSALRNDDYKLAERLISENKFDLNQDCPEAVAGQLHTANKLHLADHRPLAILFDSSSHRLFGGLNDGVLEFFSLLLKHGVNLNEEFDDGTSMLNTVFIHILPNIDALKAAKNAGANFKRQITGSKPGSWRYRSATGPDNDLTGQNFCMLLATNSSINSSLNPNRGYFYTKQDKHIGDIVQFILSQSDLSARDAYGRTALHLAIKAGNIFSAKKLLAAGSAINLEDNAGQTAKDYALASGDSDLMAVFDKIALDTLTTTATTPTPLPSPVESNKLDNKPVDVSHVESQPSSTPENSSTMISLAVQGMSALLASSPAPSQNTKVTAKPAANQTPAPTPPIATNHDRSDWTVSEEKTEQQANTSKSSTSSQVAQQYEQGRKLANKERFSEARKVWLKAAEQGYAPAQHALGRMYARGDGVRRDFSQSLKYWNQAAQQNYAPALLLLGKMYQFGDGVKRDHSKARSYYKKAAQLGSKPAANALRSLK